MLYPFPGVNQAHIGLLGRPQLFNPIEGLLIKNYFITFKIIIYVSPKHASYAHVN